MTVYFTKKLPSRLINDIPGFNSKVSEHARSLGRDFLCILQGFLRPRLLIQLQDSAVQLLPRLSSNRLENILVDSVFAASVAGLRHLHKRAFF